MSWSLSKEKTALDHLIDKVEAEMAATEVGSDEYDKLTEKLAKLYAIRGGSRQSRVSPDTIAVCVTSILNLLIIVAYERGHVITTKGFSQILRPKLPNQQ